MYTYCTSSFTPTAVIQHPFIHGITRINTVVKFPLGHQLPVHWCYSRVVCYEWSKLCTVCAPSHHTAVIPPPQLLGLQMIGSVATFVLGPATVTRSERYISSLERTDLEVPLEVEFEETQSDSTGDTIDRHVSAPGAVYNIQMWSINGANFSYDPLVAATTLLFDTGKEIASKQRHT